MVDPIDTFNAVVSFRRQTVSESREIAFMLHLDIFCSIESENGTGYITKLRTYIQS